MDLQYFNGSNLNTRRYYTFKTELIIPNLLPFYTYQLAVRFFARGIASAFSPWTEFQTNYGGAVRHTIELIVSIFTKCVIII